MPQQRTLRLIALSLVSLVSPIAGAVDAAASDETSPSVQAVWKPQEIRYSYVGYTTAYNCDAAENKLERILTAVGAHPQTQVRASGCELNRPARHFFVTITTATPVDATSVKPDPNEESRQKLLERLGVKNNITTEQFTAVRKTVDLSDDRSLNLQPGDCELMEGLRDRVFPELGIEIVRNEVHCTPRQVGIRTPTLEVSALVRAPDPDDAGG